MSKFQEYLPIYEGDRYCLMCSQACPVRRVTRSEATSPHGWALLVSSVQRGMLQWNTDAVDVLYQCADCGNCQSNCVTDRPLPYAIQAAREEVVRLGRAPAAVAALDDNLIKWGNPFSEANAAQQPTKKRSNDAASVLFVGDAAAVLKPRVLDAAETLLRAIGVSSSRGVEGRSSGYLPYTLGLWETARTFANQAAEAVHASGAERIITLSAQDAHTLLHVYPELGVKLPESVSIVTLVDVLAASGDALKFMSSTNSSYTIHDAAQSNRLKTHAANLRMLAARVMGGAPREMLFRENLATPLSAGGLQFTQPALAEKLARTRIAEARATGAEIILTDDPLDTAILETYADGMTVLNLFDVLAERLASN